MGETIDTGIPSGLYAFPFVLGDRAFCPGMSLRDWFAGQARVALGDTNPNLPGDPASANHWPEAGELARRKAVWAYLQADAMIAARGAA